jgi:CRP-like cAMP-binding protein
MEATTDSQSRNQVLAALSKDVYQRLLPHLTPADLPHGKVLYEIGDRIEEVYFPLNGLISLVRGMGDGKVVEVGLIGNDGMSGLTGLLGGETSSERAIVQIPNGAIRAKLGVIREEFRRGGLLQNILLKYVNALMRQVSQTAACNAIHTAEERLARWFLMCQDRIESEELNLTQEFIAEMIGTRRATVTAAALTLQSAQLIQYNRGRIKITDRPGLEAFACECYEALGRPRSDSKH